MLIDPMRQARADQLHAELRDARDCDALDPCEVCKAKARAVSYVHHDEAVARLIPRPRVEQRVEEHVDA